MNTLITLITSQTFKRGIYVFAFFTLAWLFPHIVILVLLTLIYFILKVQKTVENK